MSNQKIWNKPGEVHDMKGVPIYPGDLLRSFHFTGSRRKKNYLYHTAVLKDGHLWAIPTSHLDPGKAAHPDSRGGTCVLSEANAAQCEVIHGCGPKPYLDFYDRPKLKKEANP